MTATGAVGDLLGELGRMYQDSQYLVQPSESLALVGENNSGKSTIIKLLADVYEAFAGSVRIAGIGLRTLDRGSYYSLLHNGISVLRLFRLQESVVENVALDPETGEVMPSVRAGNRPRSTSWAARSCREDSGKAW